MTLMLEFSASRLSYVLLMNPRAFFPHTQRVTASSEPSCHQEYSNQLGSRLIAMEIKFEFEWKIFNFVANEKLIEEAKALPYLRLVLNECQVE
jgi:hypothetical protein